ncbi:uncharacterized protein LOC114308781 [Camellia sinensis]|uniref:uncharacterized protein LOC114308781 n=1 Tax=Camellia sinensis TaxID=4442 RepID=UPI001035ED66|nr:uncharacterized protein LOC114308781 [Camellia sinensis]
MSKENLFPHRCSPSSLCPICGKCDESIEHILFQCPWARAIRQGNDFSWYIWKARNNWVFNHNPSSPSQVLAQVGDYWQEISNLQLMARAQNGSVRPALGSVRWTPPDQGHYKLNCDASFAKDCSKTSLVVILRDWRGNLVDGTTTMVHVSSTIQSEARAVRMAYAFSQTLNFSQIQVENGSQSVIKSRVFELVPPWDCQAIIHDIHSAKSNCLLSFRHRGANRLLSG